jgi:DNA-binding response OmpR family regulator
MKVLLVEDNEKMSRFIEQGLSEQGYSVDVAETGLDGESRGAAEPYDLIVLDVMLPDEDGMQVCRKLRGKQVETPILMLTALSTTADKVAGLDAGADDYLTKPFEFVELLARVRALMRRGQAQEATTLRFEDIELDLLTRRAKRSGQAIRLTAKEFSLLEYFVRHPNRILTRTEISEHVWDMNFDHESNVIDVYVSMLRRKIDKMFEKRLIHTVIGSGYMLSAQDPSVT